MNRADFDVVVAGAGIHGAGVAQAAAAAGWRVLLLEKTAVASGTSSRSSKLIHGGLRYLESGQWRLVRESLAEREILLRLAPGLVRRVPFLIPIYTFTTRPPWKIRAGLSLYALLGGLAPEARFRSLPRAAWGDLDGLRAGGLRRVFRYGDAQTDDAALTRAVIASARRLGARILCPARLARARRVKDLYEVVHAAAGREETCVARTIVNAGGPWVNRIQERIVPPPPRRAVELVQGAHVVLPGAVERGVYYVESPRDRRAVFVMPWKGKTLVGTTETPFGGEPDAVKPLPAEIDYLVETYRLYFPDRPADVEETFAGLRVLPQAIGAPFHRSREVALVTDDPRAPRVVAIYGGKLTGYRLTALRVARLLARTLGGSPPDTASIPLEPADDGA